MHDLLSQLRITIDPQLLELALTHRSFAYENGAIPHNERLEFLGDSVLGVIVTEHLYVTLPAHAEGRLAKLRAAVVNASSLADVARALDLGAQIRLGKGEVSTAGADKSSILSDTFEAVLGALYLSAGSDAADRFVHHIFDPLIARADDLGAGLDWKTSLQELCAARGVGLPIYEITESGPDHMKQFEAVAVIGSLRFSPGSGRSKKQAEQGAAQAAFEELSASNTIGDPEPDA